ncbi:flagellar protein FlaG [Thiocystis violascens]|uniref:Flagellar protein FlaG n=1 Tax=Thiocystis violascens (strain ATCC 17096 / DSM 198 / 6111) TaxID=765911 RepID=I3Y758_THIV6|nr:flagellar protein FlaG [Thiocystis violascens]AFL72826.1 flagellar protein FlaG [Thiocystis violascens DSM 198]
MGTPRPAHPIPKQPNQGFKIMASDSFNVAAISPMSTAATPSRVAQRDTSQATTPPINQAAATTAAAQTSATAERASTGPGDANPLNRDQAGSVEQIARAVDRINEMMQNGKQALSFQLDDDSGRLVIKVTDAQTKELIRQIPSEETLQFAQYVDGLAGLIFNKKA